MACLWVSASVVETTFAGAHSATTLWASLKISIFRDALILFLANQEFPRQNF